ncbi:hypothetical protein HKX48_009310 [Thoreauomyces humboldtii]|nr:hypothetical protein HKX48_009310 [Thoreauomyces humboldtii]
MEFRELSASQRNAFITAALCLRNTPSVLNFADSRSVLDDFVAVHRQSIPQAHDVAAFLPWHRPFISMYELALRQYCNYQGTLPYWDWSYDSQAPERSPIFSDEYFGGNGDVANNSCINTGRFAGITAVYPNAHCVARAFLAGDNDGNADMYGAQYSPIEMQWVVQQATYDTFRVGLESHPHNNKLHNSMGGDMAGLLSSVNDPIFWLHHANLDRWWTRWQAAHPTLAATYGGNTVAGSTENDAALTDALVYTGMWPDAVVSDTMNFTNSMTGLLCYTYSASIGPANITNEELQTPAETTGTTAAPPGGAPGGPGGGGGGGGGLPDGNAGGGNAGGGNNGGAGNGGNGDNGNGNGNINGGNDGGGDGGGNGNGNNGGNGGNNGGNGNGGGGDGSAGTGGDRGGGNGGNENNGGGGDGNGGGGNGGNGGGGNGGGGNGGNGGNGNGGGGNDGNGGGGGDGGGGDGGDGGGDGGGDDGGDGNLRRRRPSRPAYQRRRINSRRQQVSPSPFDRTDLTRIRQHQPFPDSFYAARSMSPAAIARYKEGEARIARFVDAVNAAGWKSHVTLGEWKAEPEDSGVWDEWESRAGDLMQGLSANVGKLVDEVE